MSVFIAFFSSLAAVALGLDPIRPLDPVPPAASRGWRPYSPVGVLDETPRRLAPQYEALKAVYDRDAAFVGRIEAAMPTGAMVFQLPLLEFPESPVPAAMTAYDHGRPYLHRQMSPTSVPAR